MFDKSPQVDGNNRSNGRWPCLVPTFRAINHVLLGMVVMSVCGVKEVQATPLCQSPGFPQWSFDQSHIFPQDRPLARPEDGKALPDGRLVVADERFGLFLIEPDGSSRPFGRFVEAGYLHAPPKPAGGAQAVFLEQDTRHLLVGDIYTGKIYRVDNQTEETRLIYDHPFGVNSVYRDRNGTIWFTQSTMNTEDRGKEELWAAVNIPMPTGAVFKLPGSGDEFAERAEEVVGNLYFANGITFDRNETYMYVSESTMDRVLRFHVDGEKGTVSDREVYQTVYGPDNLAMDTDDNLWIASFLGNQVLAVDDTCQSVHKVFRADSKNHTAFLGEWVKRSHLGQHRGELLTPNAYEPLPNFL
ncbi:MAG: SMP-30/gluconolactonase/LRE family protein, partial [Nitrospirales bacterium]|nr:SMP-30/gluconolactonase/LRE family protein [Nitrospirales bacterium]